MPVSLRTCQPTVEAELDGILFSSFLMRTQLYSDSQIVSLYSVQRYHFLSFARDRLRSPALKSVLHKLFLNNYETDRQTNIKGKSL